MALRITSGSSASGSAEATGRQAPSGMFARRRIMWQYKELRENPLDGVNAAPLEHDLFTWHGNFYFPESHKEFPGMEIHFVLSLDQDFPNSMPGMRLAEGFRHSHVFGSQICFSLLREFGYLQSYGPETSHWNPSRTIRSLLESVYLFLIVDEDDYHSNQRKVDFKRAKRVSTCTQCGHRSRSNGFETWPSIESWFSQAPSTSTSSSDSEQRQDSESSTELDSGNVAALALHDNLIAPATPSDFALADSESEASSSKKASSSNALVAGPTRQRTITFGEWCRARDAGQNTTVADELQNLGHRVFKFPSSDTVTVAKPQLNLTAKSKPQPLPPVPDSFQDQILRQTKSQIKSTRKFIVRQRKAAQLEQVDSAAVRAEGISGMSLSKVAGSDFAVEGTRTGFCCGMTGVSFNASDSVILGFGVNVVYTNWGGIESISTDLEPVSYRIFLQGDMKKSALGMTVTHFMPFAINKHHWRKAEAILHTCVDSILSGVDIFRLLRLPRAISASRLKAEKLVFVIGELWKSMAVQMYSGLKFASEKVLKGFCAFHHIMLHSCMEDGISQMRAEQSSSNLDDGWTKVVRRKRTPSSCFVLGAANKKVDKFVRHESGRKKQSVPDLGRFLPQILLANTSWGLLQNPLFEELFARNSKWIVQQYPRLGNISRYFNDRAKCSWECAATGLKLTGFQIKYALRVKEWARTTLPQQTVDRCSNMYFSDQYLAREMFDELCGRPTCEMLQEFQSMAKNLDSLNSYSEYFEFLQVSGGEAIDVRLTAAMSLSLSRGYHRKGELYNQVANTKAYGADTDELESMDGCQCCYCCQG